MKPKAIIYTRVSTDKQAEEGTSLEVQEAACLRKAQEMQAEIVDIVTDEGISGAFYLSRPGIQKALGLIEAGHANVLITLKLDRSGRDTDVLRLIRKRVLAAGAQLLFADGMNFEDNAVGDLMFTQLAAFSEFERKLIRERTMSGRRRRAENGQQPTRSRSPYGLHIVTEADVLLGHYTAAQIGTYQIEDEATACLVTEMFQRYDAGQSMPKICRWLQQAGVPTPRGGEMWRPSTLTLILRNPAYKGEPRCFKQETLTDEGRIAQGMKTTGYRRQTPEAKQVKLTAPALVAPEVWERCNERIREAQAVFGGNPTRRYALSTLLRCPTCGRGMLGSNGHSRKAETSYAFYACADYIPSRNALGRVCNPETHRAAVAEEKTIDGLLYIADHPEVIDDALQAFALEYEQNDTAARHKQIEAELKTLEDKERAIVQAQVAGIQAGANPAIYARMFSDVLERRHALQQELAACPADAPLRDLPKDAGARVAMMIGNLETALRSPYLNGAEKHEILATLIVKIVPESGAYVLHVKPFGDLQKTFHTIPTV